MSFKREGDDKSLLGTLRQRRIRDLLAVDIPEDEALLTSNGRLACLVCYHRPIFDTVEMLLVHRQGKKHAAGVEWKNQEKKELQELILKRKHEQFLKDGSTDIQQSAGLESNKKLCLGPAYDSRCQKTKAKQPKMKVELRNTEQPSVPMATPATQLPGNYYSWKKTGTTDSAGKQSIKDYCSDRLESGGTCDSTSLSRNEKFNNKNSKSTGKHDTESPYNMILEKQMEGPVIHSHQLMHLFSKKSDGPIHIKPYQSKKPRTSIQTEPSININQSIDFSQEAACGNVSGQRPPKVTLQTSYSTTSDNRQSRLKTTVDSGVLNKEDILTSSNTGLMQASKTLGVTQTLKSIESRGVVKSTHLQSKPKSKSKMVESSNLESLDELQQKKESAEKYLHYRGAGWKKDLFGNWVKDEDAEFDSDEEPPDLP